MSQESSSIAKNVVSAVVMTPLIKAALVGNDTLNDSRNHINVNSVDNVVHLQGQVATEEMKQLAGKIVQDWLNQYHSTDELSNELKVTHDDSKPVF